MQDAEIEYIGIAQATELFRGLISQRQIYNLVDAGRLPHYRFDRMLRFDRRELEQWIRDCYVPSKGAS